jgi:hypothetical protein
MRKYIIKFANVEKEFNCYEPEDIKNLDIKIMMAQGIWLSDWIDMGCKNEGINIDDLGFRILYMPKGEVIPKRITIVEAPCSSLKSAYESQYNAFKYLKEYIPELHELPDQIKHIDKGMI